MKITINDEKSFQSHITYIFLRHFEPSKITKKIIETYDCFHKILKGKFFQNIKWSKIMKT